MSPSSIKVGIAKLPGKLSFVESVPLVACGYTAVTALLRVDREIPGGLKGKTVLVTGELDPPPFSQYLEDGWLIILGPLENY